MIYLFILVIIKCSREKWGDLTQSYDKIPYTHIKIQKASWQHKKRHQKLRLNNDCDRLRTHSWSNSSQPHWCGKTSLQARILPTHLNGSVIKRTWHDRNGVDKHTFIKIDIFAKSNKKRQRETLQYILTISKITLAWLCRKYLYWT